MARERVVALVDMDCFYVQVEQRLNPSLFGKPCAVVQYNSWKGGGIISVGYEARKFGVSRGMRGDQAKAKCPDIMLPQVPEVRGKADLTRYREAGAEVIEVLQSFADICERASVDEAYLDLTEEVERSLDTITVEKLADETLKCCHIIGFTDQTYSDSSDMKGQWLTALSNKENRCLALGALIIQKAREAMKGKTGFTCSAGIAHNKVLAKLAGGSHKPNQQTLLPHQSVATFFQTIPIKKVRYFGGKFGKKVISQLQVEKMSELTKFSEGQLKNYLGEKSGSWLYNVCRGTEHEPVRSRQLTKSTGCGKNFLGKLKLATREKVYYWLLQLAGELSDRLKGEQSKNHRMARSASVSVRMENDTSGVRSFPLNSTDPQSICDGAMQVIKNFNSATGDDWYPAIISLYMTASKFEETSKTTGSSSIKSFFTKKECLDANRQDIKEDTRIISDELNEEASPRNTSLASDQIEMRESLDPGNEQETTFNEETIPDTQPNIVSFFATSKAGDDANTFDYTRDEIDLSVVDELPEDIRNEIQSFLGIPQPLERKKRCLNGIKKYATFEDSTPSTSRTVKKSLSRTEDGDVGDLETFIKAGDPINLKRHEPIQCSRCSMKISPSNMTEHLDFHFAMELQKNDRIDDNSRKISPPKKRHKSTIDSFFVSKDR